MSNERRELRPLTSFRFLAALAVGLYHLWYLKDDPAWSGVAHRYFAEGSAGVTFFFILSGFVLAYTYHHRMRAPNRAALWDYAVARFARIWPVHLLTLFLILLLPSKLAEARADWAVGGPAFLANLFLIQGYIPNPGVFFSYNQVSWSLSAEVFFYLTLPLIIVVFWRTRLIQRPIDLLSLAAGMWCLQLLAVSRLPNIYTPTQLWAVYLFPPVRWFDFFIGVLMGLAFTRLGNSPAPTNRWRIGLATFLELASLGVLAIAVHKAMLVDYKIRLNGYYTPWMALVIWTFAFQRGYMSALLSGRAMVFLGEISFGFYMLHPTVFWLLYMHRETLGLAAWRPGSQAGLALLATTALSAICYRFYEMPVRRRLLGWLKSRPAKLTLVPADDVQRRAA
jgi:peptidoglycan/LPS O-acetylase OafA/YrhL